jgi:hypothetical protein
MTQASPFADQSQADRQEWEDIEAVASEHFHVWADGGDLKWAETAWQALTQAGMTSLHQRGRAHHLHDPTRRPQRPLSRILRARL